MGIPIFVDYKFAVQFNFNSSKKTASGNGSQVKIDGYGTSGQKTGDTIVQAVAEYNKSHPGAKLTVAFSNGVFTIGNSSNLKKSTLEGILAGQTYRGWFPNVKRGRDPAGNLVISLTALNPNRPAESGQRIVDGKPTTATIRGSHDSPLGKEVAQGAAIIAKYDKGKLTHLQTFGLGPCIAVVLYDPQTNTGVLAHIDTSSKAQDLQRIIDGLKAKGIKTENLTATIIGGDGSDGSDETFVAAKRVISGSGIRIAETNVGSQSSRPTGIQLNLETGEVTGYRDDMPYNNDKSYGRMIMALSESSLFSTGLRISDETSK